jgi:hypothetical protein
MTSMLYCCRPFEPFQVDPDFGAEFTAASNAGFSTALFDHTQATEGELGKAIRRVRAGGGETVYRGWMMRADEYERFYRALADKGVFLVNDPTAYRFCHHLPENYTILEGNTPRSTWLPIHERFDFASMFDKVRMFGRSPIIVKDYVKSQKHAWNEACFIPRADDTVAVERVVRRFLELQGEDLTEGLVFREHVPLCVVGTHPRSGMPLSAEVRTFWLDGKLILEHACWADLAVVDSAPPQAWMEGIAKRVPSRFFTMDVALREDGEWTVIELGDGQVAGLPTADLAARFYAALHRQFFDVPHRDTT